MADYEAEDIKKMDRIGLMDKSLASTFCSAQDNPDMLVSIVIVSYNSGPLLTECIRAVLASTVPVEVIISDNGSNDCSLSALETLAEVDPRLRLVRNKRNLGFAVANNHVLDQTQGTHVLFLNPDCLVGPTTLERVLCVLEARPESGMAGCRIVNPDGTEQDGCRRLQPNPFRLVSKALGFSESPSGNARPGINSDALSSQGEQEVEAISGAFMLIKRAALQAVGSFDEAYFMHWEDLDLCARFSRAGYSILFVPDVKAVHFKGRSSQKRPARIEWHKHLGLARFLRKFHFSRWPLPVFALLTIPIWIRFGIRVVLKNPMCPRQKKATEENNAHRDEVWIFGATSSVGQCLIPYLIANGYNVRAFSRNSEAHSDSNGLQLKWEFTDISASLPKNWYGCPRVVIHLAPLDLLPKHIAYLASSGMQQLIAFGSTSVFTKLDGAPGERALMERLIAAEKSIEAGCEKHGVRWSIFRPTVIYCPGLDRSVSLLVRFIRQTRFFPILGDAQGLRQPVHADDLARACLLLLSSGRGWNHTYNLSGGETLSYREMIGRLFYQQGMRPRIIRVPDRLFRVLLLFASIIPAYRSLNIKMARRTDIDMDFDHSSATEAFGYDPRSFLP